jgi:hypothetical protein
MHPFLFYFYDKFINNGIGNMNKMQSEHKSKDKDAANLCENVMLLEKIKVRCVQTISVIGSVGCLGYPQACGFHHC